MSVCVCPPHPPPLPRSLLTPATQFLISVGNPAGDGVSHGERTDPGGAEAGGCREVWTGQQAWTSSMDVCSLSEGCDFRASDPAAHSYFPRKCPHFHRACLPPLLHTFQLWVLTEQHGKRVEELQAELRQKEVQLGQAQQGRQAQEAQLVQHAQQASGGGNSSLRLFYLQGLGFTPPPPPTHRGSQLLSSKGSPSPLRPRLRPVLRSRPRCSCCTSKWMRCRRHERVSLLSLSQCR